MGDTLGTPSKKFFGYDANRMQLASKKAEQQSVLIFRWPSVVVIGACLTRLNTANANSISASTVLTGLSLSSETRGKEISGVAHLITDLCP